MASVLSWDRRGRTVFRGASLCFGYTDLSPPVFKEWYGKAAGTRSVCPDDGSGGVAVTSSKALLLPRIYDTSSAMFVCDTAVKKKRDDGDADPP